MNHLSTSEHGYYITLGENFLNASVFDKLVFSLFNFPYFEKNTTKKKEAKKIVIDFEKVKESSLYGGIGVFLLDKFLNTLPDLNFSIKYPLNGALNDTLGILRNTHATDKNRSPRSFCDNPYWRINDKKNSIKMFSVTEDENGFRKLLDTTINIFQPHLVQALHYPEYEVNYIQHIVGELTQNILDHSTIDSTPKGYIALSATKESGEISVMDLGIGIPNRLGNSLGIKNEFLALKSAFDKRVTSRATERRGIGLLEVKKIIKDLHGYLSVRSNRAKVSFSPKSYKPFGKSWIPSTFAYFPGTQVEILFFNKSHQKG